MKIAESTVNMLSGRHYTQTGMRSGGNKNGFTDMLNSYSMKQSPMAMDSYQTGKELYSETEETGFHASGRVLTEDSRTIDFNVNLLMSRSYKEYMKVNVPTMADALCDPLIVNIDGDTADLRDRTFRFDLDDNGKEDEISMPGKGSGFLALDKNGDGKINDGSELFGAKSGDGFGDLREYDSDGNGWIDENDEIFSKLQVWSKDDNGKDKLMNLKQADIGAIYLGEQQTEFSLGGADGYRDGVIRSTGVFLRESTGAGTVQHVDLSLKQNGVGLRVSGDDTLPEISSSDNRISESSAARRREENRRRKAKARKKKAEDKAAEEALNKRRMEHKEYMKKLQEKQFMERKEYHEELHESFLQTS
ncbi:MAG: hypothetical protein K6B28_03655 [Lachnospiraceae bacterium]|nr:hypothetical protein [Lachnospiraceae bacterium]